MLIKDSIVTNKNIAVYFFEKIKMKVGTFSCLLFEDEIVRMGFQYIKIWPAQQPRIEEKYIGDMEEDIMKSVKQKLLKILD